MGSKSTRQDILPAILHDFVVRYLHIILGKSTQKYCFLPASPGNQLICM